MFLSSNLLKFVILFKDDDSKLNVYLFFSMNANVTKSKLGPFEMEIFSFAYFGRFFAVVLFSFFSHSIYPTANHNYNANKI